VTDVVSEASGLGFSGTNAGGELYLINSVYRDNNNADAPTKGLARLA
jgi:hypothetical protein